MIAQYRFYLYDFLERMMSSSVRVLVRDAVDGFFYGTPPTRLLHANTRAALQEIFEEASGEDDFISTKARERGPMAYAFDINSDDYTLDSRSNFPIVFTCPRCGEPSTPSCGQSTIFDHELDRRWHDTCLQEEESNAP